MATGPAKRPPALAPVRARASAPPWDVLGRRQVAEIAMPGVVIGLLGGLIAAILGAAGGLDPDVALVAGVALGVPLALGGAGYEMLLARGRIPLSMLAPVALYWVVAFTVARVVNAAVLKVYAGESVAVPYGWLDFVVYQMLLSVAFGVGYWWLHENFAPRWWFHLRDRNPVADHFIREKLDYAGKAEAELKRRRDGKRRR